MTLTAVSGLEAGHWHDLGARTGCTVVLCPDDGCVASVDVRGGAPGTRETALLEPEKTVGRAHALLLTGGSAFGLEAATGVMRWLAERRRGFATPFAVVPIVPAAVIYDLGVGDPARWPEAASGYAACSAANAAPVAQGRVGAGAGATCGKYLGFAKAQPSGLGGAAVSVGGATVAALSVANPVGDLVDPASGELVAGVVGEMGSYLERFERAARLDSAGGSVAGANTTLVVVATDAPLTKAEAKVLAQSAHVGVARVTRPSHTVADGDTAFALSTGAGPTVPLMLLSVAAQEVVAEAILNGARASRAD